MYVADIGSDDGSRLAVDGTLVYNSFVDQGYAVKPRVLMNLTGSSNLLLDFYENGGGNQVSFQTLTLVLANNLASNTTQSVCLGTSGSAISGDVYGTLPTGITLSATGYQWSYSTTPGGTRTNITGATAATYAPSTSAAPFNVPGTYYIYRNAKLLSASNNTGVANYIATNESNAATLTVIALPSVAALGGGATSVCVGFTTPAFTDATAGGTWSITNGSGTASITAGGIVTGLTGGNVTVVYTYNDGTCSNTAQQTLTVNALPAVSAASSVCIGGTITLSPATGGTWISNDATKASVTNAGVVTGIAAGSVTFTFTNTATGCSNTTSAVNVNSQPTASAGGSQTICFSASATVSGATSSNGTILWTNNGHGSITNATTLTPTYTPGAGDENTTVILTLTVSNAPCAAATAIYTVIVQAPTANAGAVLSDICKGGISAPLGGSVGGTATGGTWSDNGVGGTFSPGATNLNATWTPPANYTGTATLTLTTSGGSCGTATASKTQLVDANCQIITLTQPAVAVTVSAGKTNVSCAGAADGTITVSGVSAGATYIIQLNGTGTGSKWSDNIWPRNLCSYSQCS